MLPSKAADSNIPSLDNYQPAAFESGQSITPTRYFSVSLLDPNGVPQRDVRFETSGNQTLFIRPPYAGMQLEILDGDLVTSRFEIPIQGHTFAAGEAPKAFKLIGFENLLGSRAIFGVGFNTASPFDITASAEGGSGLTTVGEDTAALNTAALRDAGTLTLIENDFAFDIDGDGVISVTTDGELVIRYMDGKTGNALIQGALSQTAAAQGATRTDAVSILNYLQGLEAAGRLDVDQNTLVEKKFDGVLILRHLSGIGSSINSLPALTDKPGEDALLGEGALRVDPQSIADFIDVGNLTKVRANPNFAKDTLSRTNRESPSEIESNIDSAAVIGSSPYVPFLTTYANGVATYELNTFGSNVEFLNTYLRRDDDPEVRDLIQSRAKGTPGRTLPQPDSSTLLLTDFAALDNATSRADLLDDLRQRLTTETDTDVIGVDEPLFIRLPESGGYEFSLPDAGSHQITRLIFDPAVDGNAFLNHLDSNDDRDFTLFIPSTNSTFPVSIETPFDLPAGTKTFRLFPRGIDENADLAKLFEPENASPPALNVNVGLILNGDTNATPTLTVKALQNDQADINTQAQLDVPNPVDLPTQIDFD